MAKRKKKVPGVDIDWYLISIERLKQIALVILLILLGLGAWWYFVHNKANPRSAAQAATLLGGARYVDAESAAVESQTISRAALSGAGGGDNDAQFLTVEGDVQFQKGPTGDWKPAEARTPLYNGDWVKT